MNKNVHKFKMPPPLPSSLYKYVKPLQFMTDNEMALNFICHFGQIKMNI